MMTVHVLHAGDGYTYLTRQVASGDELRPAGESLADYYAHEGNPPGRWVGEGLAGLGVSGRVSEDQMKALFGEGLHPKAEAMIRQAMSEGATPEAAIKQARLGRRFPWFADMRDEEWPAAVSAAYAEFKADHERAPAPGVERDLIRWNVAGTILTRDLGREPSEAERSTYLASRGRQQRQPVAGYDLVFTPAKSVSTLWALGDEHTRREVAAAHEAAWREAFGWVEGEAGVTRIGKAGAAQINTLGLVAVAFDHADSRTGDPNLHTHVAVANKVQGADGKWRALDARVLHALGVAASERYNALVEEQLTSRLGVRFVDEARGRGKHPVREIDGILREVRQAFSSRRAAIEESYSKLVADYRAKHGHEPPRAAQFKLAQQATIATREGKKEGVSLSERRARWRAQAAAVLGSDPSVDGMVASALGRTDAGGEGEELDVEQVARQVVEQVAAKRATWGPWHLMAEALRQVRRHPGTDDVAAVAARVAQRAEALSVRLDPPELNPTPDVLRRESGESIYTVHGKRTFTSRAVLDAENNLVQGALRAGGLVVGEPDFTAARESVEAATGRILNEGQVELARCFAAGGHEVEAGIGPAGAGKTTAMAVFARAVERAGGRVLALAPSAAASSVLGEELGVPADTVHKLLYAHEFGEVPEALEVDGRTVLLVDEAGMAGTPTLDAALALARSHGASIRLLGDPQQLASVAAGGALRLIDERVGAAHLSQVQRFADPDEAEASLKIRDGDPAGAQFYLEWGRVAGGTRAAMLEEVYAAWAEDTAAGKRSVMVAGSNEDATTLGAQARRELVAAGTVEPDGVALHDGNTAGRGDVIVTRLNQRSLATANGKDFVKNGDTWHVLDTGADGRLRVRHTGHLGTVTLPAEYVAEHIQLAYAATIHRVQGMTVDTSHSLLSAGADRQSLYTATTRGRQSNRLYLVTEDTVDVDSHGQLPPAQAPADVLMAIVGRDGAARSATTTQAEEYAEAHSLARLVPELEDARDRLLDPNRNERLTETARAGLGDEAGETVVHDPAWPALADRLAHHEATGADVTGLVREAGGRWEGADSMAQVLHHRIGPPPDGPWTFLPPTDDGDPVVRAWAQRHAELIEQRIDHLLDHAAASHAEWLPEQLRRPEHDERAAQDWTIAARAVVAYRDRYGITGTAPLGPRPQHGRVGQDYDRADAALARMRRAAAPERQPQPDLAGAQPTAADRIRRLRERGGEETGTGDEQSLDTRERLAQARERHRQQQEERRRTAREQQPPEQRGPGRGGQQL